MYTWQVLFQSTWVQALAFHRPEEDQSIQSKCWQKMSFLPSEVVKKRNFIISISQSVLHFVKVHSIHVSSRVLIYLRGMEILKRHFEQSLTKPVQMRTVLQPIQPGQPSTPQPTRPTVSNLCTPTSHTNVDDIRTHHEQCLAEQATTVLLKTSGIKTVEDTSDHVNIKTSQQHAAYFISQYIVLKKFFLKNLTKMVSKVRITKTKMIEHRAYAIH